MGLGEDIENTYMYSFNRFFKRVVVTIFEP